MYITCAHASVHSSATVCRNMHVCMHPHVAMYMDSMTPNFRSHVKAHDAHLESYYVVLAVSVLQTFGDVYHRCMRMRIFNSSQRHFGSKCQIQSAWQLP